MSGLGRVRSIVAQDPVVNRRERGPKPAAATPHLSTASVCFMTWNLRGQIDGSRKVLPGGNLCHKKQSSVSPCPNNPAARTPPSECLASP